MRNDAWGVVSELAASPNNVFTRSQAAAQGIDHRRIAALKARGLLVEPWPGVLIALSAGGTPTWLQLMTAATAKSGPGSHRAGAMLHRLDGCTEEVLETSCLSDRSPRLPGVIVHRVSSLDRRDIVMVDGVPCTSLARTLADLGSVVSGAVVERALDDALRRGANVRWLQETAARVRRPSESGPPTLLRLLDRFQGRGKVRGSWFEKLVEECLAHPELSGLVRQHELRDPAGVAVARFDLAVLDAKFGIEAHSRSHHFGAENEASDEHRDHAAGVLGWDVMYLGYRSVHSPRKVMADVLARVRSRRQLLGIRT